MDTATTVAVFGFLGIVCTGMVTVVVSLITNRREKEKTAETTMERTLRERLLLRDEQLADRDADITRLRADRDYWRAKVQGND
jgi:hypothetical protein